MAKYFIELEDVPSMLEEGHAFFKCLNAPWWYISDMIIKRLEQCEDAEPKTGEWREHIFDGIMGGRPRALMCTRCNFISLSACNYCPNCGARMLRGEEE
jgi:hypothetical protein